MNEFLKFIQLYPGAFIIASVIVALLSIITTIFREEIKNLFIRNDKNHLLIGKWKGKWILVSPKNYDRQEVEDIFEITEVKKRKFKGKGSNDDFENYHLEGWISEHSISFLYRGERVRSELLGTVLIRKNGLATEMQGYWFQFNKKHNLMQGTVTLIKQA